MVIIGSRAIAKHLGVSYRTVCRLVNAHELPVIVSGRCFMTTSHVLEQWERNYPKPLKDSAPPDPNALTR